MMDKVGKIFIARGSLRKCVIGLLILIVTHDTC
jgi:hypothetical protein